MDARDLFFKYTKNNKHQGHEFIDLGLPSGNLWATCNIGAKKPECAGLYFKWGSESGSKVTKFNYFFQKNIGKRFNFPYAISNNGYGIYGSMAPVDELTTLYTEDNNPARNMWGGRWTMPTYEDIRELMRHLENRVFTSHYNTYFRMFSCGYKKEIIFPIVSIKYRQCAIKSTNSIFWTTTLAQKKYWIKGNSAVVFGLGKQGFWFDSIGIGFSLPIRPIIKFN